MKAKYCLFLLLILTSFIFLSKTYAQNYRVLESTSDHITIEFNFFNSYVVVDTVIDGRSFQIIRGDDNYFRNPGEPWLPEININIGIPHNSDPSYTIIRNNRVAKKNQFIVPFPEADPLFEEPDVDKIDREIYSTNKLFPEQFVKLNPTFVFRYSRIIPVSISPYQFNPVTRDLIFNNNFVVRIDYHNKGGANRFSISDPMTNNFLKTGVINYEQAENWISKESNVFNSPQGTNDYWYNPNKNYFKLYLKTKGVYRVTYEELVAAGVPLGSNTPATKIEIFNYGISIPIDIVDNNNDKAFNSGDYIQFVGKPPSPSPYSHLNIYTNSNVYWFSYESDSTGNNYVDVDGFPDPQSYDETFTATRKTLHFEKDSIYERLGYSLSSNVDYWFWGKATAQDGHAVLGFEDRFSDFPNRTADSNWVTLRVQMHGMTNSIYCDTDHKAEIYITDQPIGVRIWDGQAPALFEKKFYISGDSIQIFPTGNRLDVFVRGDICTKVNFDEIRINWYEFEYWRNLKTNPNNFIFKSYKAGNNRFWMTGWLRDNIKIYMPERNKMISNAEIVNDQYNSVRFVDTSAVGTEYFLIADDYYLTVDSIVEDQPSNLRDLSNGADYILITHPDFLPAAQDLADYRSGYFPDTSITNVRIKIVNVMQIYDEFSYGMLDPFALKNFVQYAFENWQSPAPSYVALMGDMSYDYRGLLEDGSPNFIPSIPFFAYAYGQAASDNMIVAVAGGDITPDLAIGRLSCETMDEANILVNKIINYPDDDTKPWKENVILLASGLSEDDENNFGFNDESLMLGNTYIIPGGYTSTYIFRYPTKPEHEPYQGGGPEMREEINKGAAFVNYYGHGGGLQWDLVFTDDDIDLLENEGRLPVVLSLTCYTAHFDNQKIFGEHFNLVENKGSIGFFGSSGLTYWGVGKTINRMLFGDLFFNQDFVIGKAILMAKNLVPNSGIYGIQVALLTYLGDPALKVAVPELPDFALTSADITISPENPIVDDTVTVKINVTNYGSIFKLDSVAVELSASSSDTSYLIGITKLPSFGQKDSVSFTWIPTTGNLFQLTAKVNETDIIPEMDHSDNVASEFFLVFNISEPNILEPIDGYSSSSSSIDFAFSDIGHYLHRDLTYFIEIDTSLNFNNPVVISPGLTFTDPLVKWQSPNLSQGVYFWRARIFDGQDYGNWGATRSFSIMNNPKNGYYAHGNIFKTFNTYNITYSDSAKSLSLNTKLLPARPYSGTLIEDILPDPALPDTLNLTTITTDGTYLYFADNWFVAFKTKQTHESGIYKVGTGNNGTVKGHFYGQFSTYYDSIANSITYHSDGYIYVTTYNAHKLVRISVATEEIDTVDVPLGLLRWDNSLPEDGSFYISSDGQYIYNLTLIDQFGNRKYTLRTFDPANGFALVKPDMVLSGTSYTGFSGFFVFGDYIYVTETFLSNYIRRIRLSDGFFEEEWLAVQPFQSYYAWCTDWQNNAIYASVYRASGFQPKFSKFVGNYVDASGFITTKSVGPVAWWNNLSYDFYDPSTTGEYHTRLLGYNNTSKDWDTLKVDVPDTYSLQNIDAKVYPKLRLNFVLTDSSFTTINPMELKNVNFDYQPLPDVYFVRNDLRFSPDSILQGYPIEMSFNARNFGDVNVNNMDLKFYLNGLDSIIYSTQINVPADSISNEVSYTINTDQLLFDNEIRVLGTSDNLEYFNFDNFVDNEFFVVRDSLRPDFSITFDGKEIINGDIISARPDIMITLEDNSPLSLDTSFFTIIYDNAPLYFAQPELSYSYSPYPNSRFEIHWKPELPDGKHILEVLAKDASNNFFDTTSSRTVFNVFNEEDLIEVYNYPNPFTNDTYFTFILHGAQKPDKLYIKIYTIAGRLIRDIDIPIASIVTGFNKVYWDGKDQDGDDIANGLYLYKVIAKFPDETKSVTQKLARVR
ncbi:lys-gingipain precursor [bacterium BMS3Abin03]|nr:lys-gingipain precursor [bacterium BMS3Abin03]